MSNTNLQLITDAFQRAGIVDETQSPTAAQGVNGLRLCNGYFATLAVDGIRLGWFPQTNLASNCPLKDADYYDATFLLAQQFAGAYGISITDPVTIKGITDAETRLGKRSSSYFESDLSELSRAQGAPWGGIGYF